MTALAAVLSTYPPEVVAKVCDPRTGIAGQSQWLPTVFEVRHACEEEVKPIREAEARERRRAESARVMAENDKRQRKSFAELAAQYPDIIGQSAHSGNIIPKPTKEQQDKIYAGLVARKDSLSAPLAPSPRLAAMNAKRRVELDKATDGDAA